MVQNGCAIIIGRDHFNLIEQLDVRKGAPGTPIAIKYKLGWALSVPNSDCNKTISYKISVDAPKESFHMRTPESYIEEIAKTEFIGCETKETQHSPADERTKAHITLP